MEAPQAVVGRGIHNKIRPLVAGDRAVGHHGHHNFLCTHIAEIISANVKRVALGVVELEGFLAAFVGFALAAGTVDLNLRFLVPSAWPRGA